MGSTPWPDNIWDTSDQNSSSVDTTPGHTWNGDFKRPAQEAKFAGSQNWSFVCNQNVDKNWILKFDAECNSENVCTGSDVHICGHSPCEWSLAQAHLLHMQTGRATRDLGTHARLRRSYCVVWINTPLVRIAANWSDCPGRRRWNFVSCTPCYTPLRSWRTRWPSRSPDLLPRDVLWGSCRLCRVSRYMSREKEGERERGGVRRM